MSDSPLDKLLAAARQTPERPVAIGDCSVPPGFARGVVSRWLASLEESSAESWAVISRRGLAVALGLMLASVLWHARVERGPVLLESSASDTVLLSIQPQ